MTGGPWAAEGGRELYTHHCPCTALHCSALLYSWLLLEMFLVEGTKGSAATTAYTGYLSNIILATNKDALPNVGMMVNQ